MAWIVQSLNEEWSGVATSPAARRALMRWKARNPELGDVSSVEAFVDTRSCPEWGRGALRVLAVEAATDEVAARTLLQALLGGLVCLRSRVARDDPDAIGELIAIAWNRIRTYPTHRPGNVAANVLLDVRKEFIRCHVTLASGDDSGPANEPRDSGPSVEQVVGERMFLEQLVAAQERGIVSRSAFTAILRTRLGGESLVQVAADMAMSPDAIWRRRTRAERRLRTLPLAS